MGTLSATSGRKNFNSLSPFGAGIVGDKLFGLTINVARMLKILEPRPYDPTIIPVINPFLLGKYI